MENTITLRKYDLDWYNQLAGTNYDEIYGCSDADSETEAGYVLVAHDPDDNTWMFYGFDREWFFTSKEDVVKFALENGYELER